MSESILKFFGITLKPVESLNEVQKAQNTYPNQEIQKNPLEQNDLNFHCNKTLKSVQFNEVGIKIDNNNNSVKNVNRENNKSNLVNETNLKSPTIDKFNQQKLKKLTSQMKASLKFLKQNSSKIYEMKPMIDSISNQMKEGMAIYDTLIHPSEEKEMWMKEYSDMKHFFQEISDKMSYDDQQLQLQMFENPLLEIESLEKNNLAIQQIEKDMEDILITTKSLNEIISDNGKKYDTIDLNITRTLEHTKATNKNIETIEKYDRKYPWSFLFG